MSSTLPSSSLYPRYPSPGPRVVRLDPPTQTSAHFDSEPKKWEVNSAFLSPIWVTHKNINLVGFLTSKLPKTSDMSNPSIAVEENQMVPVWALILQAITWVIWDKSLSLSGPNFLILKWEQ